MYEKIIFPKDLLEMQRYVINKKSETKYFPVLGFIFANVAIISPLATATLYLLIEGGIAQGISHLHVQVIIYLTFLVTLGILTGVIHVLFDSRKSPYFLEKKGLDLQLHLSASMFARQLRSVFAERYGMLVAMPEMEKLVLFRNTTFTRPDGAIIKLYLYDEDDLKLGFDVASAPQEFDRLI